MEANLQAQLLKPAVQSPRPPALWLLEHQLRKQAWTLALFHARDSGHDVEYHEQPYLIWLFRLLEFEPPPAPEQPLVILEPRFPVESQLAVALPALLSHLKARL